MLQTIRLPALQHPGRASMCTHTNTYLFKSQVGKQHYTFGYLYSNWMIHRP